MLGHRWTIKTLGLIAFANPLIGAATAQADQATYLGQDASYCEIFQAINPSVPEHCFGELGLSSQDVEPRTRSIRIHEPSKAVQSATYAAAPADASAEAPAEAAAPALATAEATAGAGADEDYSIAMRVPFHFDSDQLTGEAKAILDRVARVLNSELMRDNDILIEGHADATGAEGYNLALSTRRALAVQAYLADEHMIVMDRLPATGKGEAEPYDPANPRASINRRVEFKNLGG